MAQATDHLFGARDRSLLVLAVLALSASPAIAQPNGFIEGFDGPGLDSAWSQSGNPASHPSAIAGTYDITHAHGDPAGGTKLNRSTSGAVAGYVHEIELVFEQHLLTGGGSTQTDFKWKSGGSDGLMEIVFNSYGHFRVNHFDFNTGNGDHIVGEHPNIIEIGYADGDLIRFTTVYSPGTDTVDVSYSLNNAPAITAYSGGGIDGPIGDVITNFVEVELFKFGDALPDQTDARINQWSLSAIAEASGDYNQDGTVDAADYTVWRDSLGQNVAPGAGADGNGSGVIDQPDYDLWAQQHGHLGAPAQSVPEAGGIVLGLVGLACIGVYREA